MGEMGPGSRAIGPGAMGRWDRGQWGRLGATGEMGPGSRAVGLGAMGEMGLGSRAVGPGAVGEIGGNGGDGTRQQGKGTGQQGSGTEEAVGEAGVEADGGDGVALGGSCKGRGSWRSTEV